MPRPIFSLSLGAFAAAVFLAGLSGCAEPVELARIETPYAESYAVVVSKKTYADAGWRDVADSLVRKRRAQLVVYEGDDLAAARPALAAAMPLYTAFVARPEECGRAYIAAAHRLSRSLDEDPYEDTIWGVITGVDAEGAKRTALATRSVIVDSALCTTGIDYDNLDSYYCLSDGKAGEWTEKTTRDGVRRGKSHEKPDATDWAERFESMQPKLLVTSSHGYENGFEMPFGRGFVQSKDGELITLDSGKVKSANKLGSVSTTETPRVWHAAGNCLVGHVTGKNAVVPVMMSRYGVVQAAGYTVATWNGAAGWGSLRLWQTLPGRYSMSEACWFNKQAMQAELLEADAAAAKFNPVYDDSAHDTKAEERFLKQASDAGVKVDAAWFNDTKGSGFRKLGLLWDRDVFAFYGDPKLIARLPYPKVDQAYSTRFEQIASNRFRFIAKVNDSGYAMSNTLPVCSLFSTRLKGVKLLSGEAYQPVLTDNFILLRKPQPVGNEIDHEMIVEFEGEPAEAAK